MKSCLEEYCIELKFYDELNYFLDKDKREVAFIFHCNDKKSNIKDIIESLGVPHTEIGQILVNGEAVDFSYIVNNKDIIAVHPLNQVSDTSNDENVLLQAALKEVKFVLDVHLGKLAKFLRLLGYDTLYRNDYDDPELAEISANENRILLTKDRGLLKRKIVQHGYCVRSQDSQKQLLEVVERYNLKKDLLNKKARCLSCNNNLKQVKKEEVADRLEPLVLQYHNDFTYCEKCDQVFWKGSHYERMKRTLIDFIDQSV